ncbi:hypothetical protein ACFLXE_05415 [Chloroflexota bacterium]
MGLGISISVKPLQRELNWLNTQLGGISGTPITNTLGWKFSELLDHLPVWMARNAVQPLLHNVLTVSAANTKLIAQGVPTGAVVEVPDEESHGLQYFLANLIVGGTAKNRFLLRAHRSVATEDGITGDWETVLSYTYHTRSGGGLCKIYGEAKVSGGGESGQMRAQGGTPVTWTETDYTEKALYSGVILPDADITIEAKLVSGTFTVRERGFNNEKLRGNYAADGVYSMPGLLIPITFEPLQQIELISETATTGDHFATLFLVRRL